MSDEIAITLCGGKYIYIRDDKGQRALRYGEKWRDLIGDGFVLAMAQEIEELQSKQTSNSDIERRAEMYRAALENIAALARARCDQDILEVAEDALAEDAQEC